MNFLKDLLGTSAFFLARPASVAPSSDSPLAQLQFALKHACLQLQAALLALKRVDEKEVLA